MRKSPSTKKHILRLWAAILPIALVSACLPDADVEELWSTVSIPPSFQGIRVIDEKTVELNFSKPVIIQSVISDPVLGNAQLETDEGGQSRLIVFENPLDEGAPYTLSILVLDASANRLELITTVRGKNNRIPPLVINEIRTEYSKPRSEFIELLCLGDGNMGGVSIYNTSRGKDEELFIFPPFEVVAGDYLVLHLRTLDEGWVQETGSPDESVSTESLAGVRDFWVEGTSKLARKNDYIVLTGQDRQILDAVILCDYSGPAWKSEVLAEGALWLKEEGAWESEGAHILPADAVFSGNATATRTINRDEGREDSDSKGDWYTTATSGASPGLPNNSTRYESK